MALGWEPQINTLEICDTRITFLRCSTNNLADTVLAAFLNGTEQFGTPSRVCTDHGGENVRVWDFMEEYRGSGRNSYIAGRSVHNSRIERLWRDVSRSVSSSYKAVFAELEQAGALNPENDCVHISPSYQCIFVKISTSVE